MMSDRLYEYNYEKPELSETYLAHHGVQGQKWGVKNGPPYPLSRQKGTGRLVGGKGSITKKKSSGGLIEKHKAKKTYKQRVQAAEKARAAKVAKAEAAKKAQEEQDKREAEALNQEMWRQDIIRRGDAAEAAKNTDLFSEQEINDIIRKYQANQKLSQLVEEANLSNTPSNIPEEKKSGWEKAGEKIKEINKFAGPMSDLASNASKMYDLYSKVAKEKDRKLEEANKREKSKAETDKIKAETENVKKGIFPPSNDLNINIKQEGGGKNKDQNQNQQKQQPQQNQNNQQKPQSKEDKEIKSIVDKLNNDRNSLDSDLKNGKISTKEYQKRMNKVVDTYTNDLEKHQNKYGGIKNNDGTKWDPQKTKEQIKDIRSGFSKEAEKKQDQSVKLANSYKEEKPKSFKDEVKTAKQYYKDTANVREQSKKELNKSKEKAAKQAKDSFRNIVLNPNTSGAVTQLITDLTKNTKTTSGQSLKVNNDWLNSQSTEVLKLMKRNIDKTSTNSSAQTIADINKILKKRGAASPLR